MPKKKVTAPVRKEVKVKKQALAISPKKENFTDKSKSGKIQTAEGWKRAMKKNKVK